MLRIDNVAGCPSFEFYSNVKTEVRRFKKQLAFNDMNDAVSTAKAKLGGEEFECWGVPSDKCTAVTVTAVEDNPNMLQAIYKRGEEWEITVRFNVKLREQ
ncbi:MAG: hypothetical protein M0P69_13800 [Bacteroidales bacterium]|jgi:hypothetical protein|nr:hypothetical protein [Bacteroidales bacterium]